MRQNKNCFLLFLYILTIGISTNSFAQKTYDYKLRLCARLDLNIPAIGSQKFNDIWGWTSENGREYAIIGSVDSTYFVEVTDPYHPVIRDVEAGKAAKCIHRDYQTYQHYCYAVADEGNSSLQIFDLRFLPDSVHKVYDSDTLVKMAHDIFISGKHLFFANSKRLRKDHSISRYVMTVASLDNPEIPEFINNLYPTRIAGSLLFNEVHDLYVNNDTAYLNCGFDGLFIYDYRNAVWPTLITQIQNYPDVGYNHSCWATQDGNYLVFTDETPKKEVKIYDIKKVRDTANKKHDADFITKFGSHAAKGSIAHNPFVRGDLLFLSYYHDGVVVYDLKDATNPKLVTSYDTYPQNDTDVYSGFEGCWGVYPYLNSGTIIASDMSNGLFVLRLDTFTAIHEIIKPEVRVNVFPNPAKDVLWVDVLTPNPERITITINDVLGIEIYRNDFMNDEIKINLPKNMGEGIYLLSVSGKGFRQTVKLIKSK
ncbi:MAG: choice-of-anchor B family protein [Bacteroidetes bacterium]|nr:choice-of-anchor B family protein [Bacteroidota bacterium]